MKIAILKGLEAVAANDKRLKKALGVFCVIKSIHDSGYVSSKSYPQVAEACHISLKTLYTRIKDMRKYNLVTNKAIRGYNKHITLTSWEKVMATYDIEKLKFTYVKNTTAPHLILNTLFIRTLEGREVKACNRKVNKFVFVRQYLEQVTGLKAPEQGFLAAVLKLQLALYNANVTEHEVFAINASTSPSHKTIKKHFGYKSNGSVHYMMQTLKKKGLVAITPREQVIHQNVYKAPQNEAPRIGNVFWSRPDKARKLQLTNQTLFFPNGNFEKN